MHAPRPRIVAQYLSGTLNQCGIPGGSESDAAGESSGRPVIAKTYWTIGHFDRRETNAGNRPNVEVLISTDVVDLLFQSHSVKNRLHTRLDFGRIRGRSLRNTELRHEYQTESNEKCPHDGFSGEELNKLTKTLRDARATS
jgi:hypothetical protein